MFNLKSTVIVIRFLYMFIHSIRRITQQILKKTLVNECIIVFIEPTSYNSDITLSVLERAGQAPSTAGR